MKKYLSIEEYLVKKDKKNYPFIKIIIIITSLVIITISLYNIFNWYFDNSKIKKIDKNLSTKNKTIYEINLSTLQMKNKDTVAFIHMKNPKINYPVVQTENNSYYLTHDFNKEKNNAGWIFMDYRNNINNLSDNTIIYGHGRVDGNLFGNLKKVLKESWQNKKDNHLIQLSTTKEVLTYQIFSIYTIKSEGYYISTNFINIQEKKLWLNTIQERNTSNINLKVKETDKILTLSTCLNNTGTRIVIHSKLINKKILNHTD